MLIIAYILVSWDKSNTVITSGAMVGSFLGVISSLIYLRIKYNRSPYYNKSNSYSLRDLRKRQKILRIDPNRYWSFINATFKFSRLAYNTACITRIINRNSRTIWNIQSRFCIHANNCYFCKRNCISVNTTLNFRIGQRDINLAKITIQNTNRLAHVLTAPLTIWLMALTVPLNVGLFTDVKAVVC